MNRPLVSSPRSSAPTMAAGGLTLALFAVGALTIDQFASAYSISAALSLAAFVGIAAAGQTVVMLVGGLDLSIPFVIGLGNVVVAGLLDRGWPFATSVLFVFTVAAILGGLNGLLSSSLSLSPVVVTLGMGVFVQGLYQHWTRGQPVGQAPSWLSAAVAPGSATGPIPVAAVVVFWAVFAALVVLVLRYTVPGRKLYAMGSNPAAARLCLVSTRIVWTCTFAVSAVMAAMTGVLLLGFTGSASASAGDPYFFLTIAAVVLGGTSMLGGHGGYGATVVGALLLTELTVLLIAVGASLPGIGSSQALSQVVLGLVIIAMVAAYGREPHVRNRI